MSSSPPPPVTPWHRRVLEWLGVEAEDSSLPAQAPNQGDRFPWEPVPPAPRPPQWGAADLPALLLGLDEEEPARDGALRCGAATAAAPQPSPTPHPDLAS